MIELEKTYLAKKLPELTNCKYKEIIDIYIPFSKEHPVLRIRKNGNQYEITKKQPIDNDASEQNEDTIKLTEKEYETLSKVEGKRVAKRRYYYEYKGRIAEIDVFLEELYGLVLIDFEFTKKEDKDNFEMPDFCLKDITPELFIAGGMICGKKYSDIKEDLKKHGYEKIEVKLNE